MSRSRPDVEPDLQLYGAISPHRDYVRFLSSKPGVTLHSTLQRPNSRGELTLRSADPLEYPSIDPRYFSSDPADRDIRTMVEGRTDQPPYRRAVAVEELIEGEVTPSAEAESDTAIAEYVRGHCTTLYHASSTCRMGTDKMAVGRSQKLQGSRSRGASRRRRLRDPDYDLREHSDADDPDRRAGGRGNHELNAEVVRSLLGHTARTGRMDIRHDAGPSLLPDDRGGVRLARHRAGGGDGVARGNACAHRNRRRDRNPALLLLQIALRGTDELTVMICLAAQPILSYLIALPSPAYDWNGFVLVGAVLVTAFVGLDIAAQRWGTASKSARLSFVRSAAP